MRGSLGLGSRSALCTATAAAHTPPFSPRHLSASLSSVPPVPTSTHRALAPSVATFSPAVSSRVPVEKPRMLGLNFFRMSLKGEMEECTGEWEMDVQCWGTGVDRTLLVFSGWADSPSLQITFSSLAQGRVLATARGCYGHSDGASLCCYLLGSVVWVPKSPSPPMLGKRKHIC